MRGQKVPLEFSREVVRFWRVLAFSSEICVILRSFEVITDDFEASWISRDWMFSDFSESFSMINQIYQCTS